LPASPRPGSGLRLGPSSGRRSPTTRRLRFTPTPTCTKSRPRPGREYMIRRGRRSCPDGEAATSRRLVARIRQDGTDGTWTAENEEGQPLLVTQARPAISKSSPRLARSRAIRPTRRSSQARCQGEKATIASGSRDDAAVGPRHSGADSPARPATGRAPARAGFGRSPGAAPSAFAAGRCGCGAWPAPAALPLTAVSPACGARS
jgi:hypothetical protein